MKRFVLLLALVLSEQALGWELLEPTKVGVEGEKYDVLRDPYLPDETPNWNYGAAMYAKFSLIGSHEDQWRLFYDPRLHFRGTDAQVRQGGLYYETGFEITRCRGLRVFRRHQSDHVFDRTSSNNERYPLLDSYVVQAEWQIGQNCQ